MVFYLNVDSFVLKKVDVELRLASSVPWSARPNNGVKVLIVPNLPRSVNHRKYRNAIQWRDGLTVTVSQNMDGDQLKQFSK